MYLGGVGNELDQHTVYEILKEFTKLFFKMRGWWVEHFCVLGLDLQYKSKHGGRCVLSAGIVKEENVDGGSA